MNTERAPKDSAKGDVSPREPAGPIVSPLPEVDENLLQFECSELLILEANCRDLFSRPPDAILPRPKTVA